MRDPALPTIPGFDDVANYFGWNWAREQQLQNLDYALQACDRLPDPDACRRAHARPWEFNTNLPVGWNPVAAGDVSSQYILDTSDELEAYRNSTPWGWIIAGVVVVGAGILLLGGRR